MDLRIVTDEVLTERLQQGDGYAFEEIYMRYWTRLYLAAFKKTSSKESAEELVQDIFMNLWLGRQHLLITSSLEAYLFTSLKYKIINFFKSRLVRSRFAANQLQEKEAEENFTEQEVMLTEMQRCLENGLNCLPEKSRQVFTLSRFSNLSNKEIGEQLVLSDKAVEYHITKAIKVLRTYMKDYVAPLFIFLLKYFSLPGNS